MERVEVELFTDGGNNAVVRMPGRNFPGVLIQGDSLSIIRSDVADIRDACRTGDANEARELAELLLDQLDAIMLRYTDALERHDLRKPF
jgi:DNA-binding FadR family transcriptional regulator